MRVEAPGGIERLQVSERSYEVDLARSPELQHLPLFSLERRVWSLRDVTLDFAPYINAKLGNAGEYAFEIAVRDRGRESQKSDRKTALAHEAIVVRCSNRWHRPPFCVGADVGLAASLRRT